MPTPALVVMILNYCQKVFFCLLLLIFASIKFTEKKAKYKVVPLLRTCVMRTERSCVARATGRKARHMTLLFFKTYSDQFYPVKPISVFIVFNHGENVFLL